MDEGRLSNPNPLCCLGILYPNRYRKEEKVVQVSSDLRRKKRSGMLSRKVVWCNVMEVNIPKKTFGRQPNGKLMKYLSLCPAKKRIKSLWKMHVVDRSACRQRHYKDNVNGVAYSNFIAKEVAFLTGDLCCTARKIIGPSIRDVQVMAFWRKEGTPL
jgi:hypothetical protein